MRFMYKYVIEHSLFKFFNYHEHKKIVKSQDIHRFSNKKIIITLMIAMLGNLHYVINSR